MTRSLDGLSSTLSETFPSPELAVTRYEFGPLGRCTVTSPCPETAETRSGEDNRSTVASPWPDRTDTEEADERETVTAPWPLEAFTVPDPPEIVTSPCAE
jgi:hypothetical protein